MNPEPSNRSISAEARPVVEALSRFAARTEVAAALKAARDTAAQRLRETPALAAASVALDPAALGWVLPAAIGSVRVSVTRAPLGDAIERHANSIQYLFVLDGPVETHVETATGWRIDRYGLGGSAVLEDRWHVVPQGAWHKTVAPGLADWAIVAFHSAHRVSDEYRTP
jgi:hypothetical protein